MSHQSAATPGIGQLRDIVVDCPEPRALAAFWSVVLGRAVINDDPEWVSLAADTDGATLSFQRVAKHLAPTWPGARRPQQLHLDVLVADLAAGERAVLALGASPLSDVHGSDANPWRVYADPAGHPFCLVTR